MDLDDILNAPGDQQEESRFQKWFGSIVVVVLLAAVGGGLCVGIAQTQLARQDRAERNRELRGDRWTPYGDVLRVRFFDRFGLRDWRVQFAMGATLGGGLALLWMRRWKREEEKVTLKRSDLDRAA